MKRKLLLVGALLACHSALAYILPGNSIVRRLAGKRDELQVTHFVVKGAGEVSGEAAKSLSTALGVSAVSPSMFVDAKVMMKTPGRCRLEVTSSESTKVVASIRNGSRARAEGGSLPALSVAVDNICALLAIRSSSDNEAREAIEKLLASHKIDARKTSLSRVGGQVALVLGDASDTASQLWVYKDSFLPARIRYKDASGAFWDVRMMGYASPGTGEVFPRQLEVLKNGTLLFKLTANEGDSATQVDDKAFSL